MTDTAVAAVDKKGDKRDIRGVAEAIGPGEAARRLGVSTRTVQRWLRDGRLPAVRVGGRLKVEAGALPAARASAAATAVIGELAGRRTIRRLLVANRGELVVRIARTCALLGIDSIALVAEDQARAWWAGAADERAPLRGSYLDAQAVIDAARRAGADAIHPGYGFLAENAEFAAAVERAGMAWVGPPPAAMRALGDKAAARRLAAQAGVPVLPGYDDSDQSDGTLEAAARRIGFPLLVKPSAGGGGKGMHVVRGENELGETLRRARREARTAFGDERLVLERHLERPRHVEVQLLLDGHGNGVHLGERECSLQRRHQKVIEEAPSPAVDEALRKRLGAAALALARAGGYEGAGTAEFLLDDGGNFYFLELNARLQVEHPVTEMVTGRDLVADQLRVAAGAPLGVAQADVALRGHAIEARLYAEDPWHDFLPATGELLELRWPQAEAVRVDGGVGVGDAIGSRYDPLLAKIICHAPERPAALSRLLEALRATVALGVTTNRGFLAWLLEQPAVRAAEVDTEWIDRQWQPDDSLSAAAWATAARLLAADRPRTGFRLNQPPVVRIELDGALRSVTVDDRAQADADDGMPSFRLPGGGVMLDVDGRAVAARLAPAPTVEAAVRQASHHRAGSATVSAPMPGAVLEIRVAAGDEVEAGQVLLVLEAMKMENAVVAPGPGVVESVLVEPRQQVTRGQPLVELS